jgi:hypothetical protein
MVMSFEDAPWRHRTVALVGNASSLRERPYGPDIDSHDVVIRINQGAFVPLSQEHTGVRTDAVFITLNGMALEKLWMWGRCKRKAPLVVAMSPKKRTVLGVDLSKIIPVYPAQWHQDLHQKLGARPSTGAMAVDLLCRSVDDASQISIYGFDFWGSPTTYTGIAKAAPHDPVAEEKFVVDSVGEDRVHR